MKDMPDILKRICEVKRTEIERLREGGGEPLRTRLAQQEGPRGFRAALAARPEVALIAEVKKASPSAGVIREDFVPRLIARAYREGGARCLSVLTDEEFFQGSLTYLAEAREAVDLPVLRKDFILDELQVLEARAWGADCVLLIVAALEQEELADLQKQARDLGMDALVEVHTREELEVALSVEADLIGINNRDLRTFEVRLETSHELAAEVPDEAVIVAESGIKSREDVERLKESGVDAILVGESLMRSPDLVGATRRLSDV
jgi:indole-3-glycerol phosphate synthase